MITARVWRSGESLVVTIPPEEVARYRLEEGQLVTLELHPAAPAPEESPPALAPDLRESFERQFKKHEAALRYLADR